MRSGTSIGGLLLGFAAAPPLPILRLAGRLPWMGLCRCRFFVETDDDRLALTLDDGPHPKTTPALLATLAKHKAKATFFLHGCWAARCPDLVAAIADAGHEIGNHTWHDEKSRKLPLDAFRDSLKRTHEVLTESQAGRPESVRLFRPAGGWPSKQILACAQNEPYEYATILASIYPFDPQVPVTRWIIDAVVNRVQPGAIIVLHEGAGRRRRVAGMVDEILTRLPTGYEVTTVSDLVSGAAASSASASG